MIAILGKEFLILALYLAQALDQTLSQSELSSCRDNIQILQPAAGKKFWQTADAPMGISYDFEE
ncbi:hypothetical protein [Floridanema evergladense]|uniref:Uncharacterized protein n=1 Tax=Floridaenema evergladense BLCC-F167 TaxID=3153639 RepID=A0ABV4WV43_9CYAN